MRRRRKHAAERREQRRGKGDRPRTEAIDEATRGIAERERGERGSREDCGTVDDPPLMEREDRKRAVDAALKRAREGETDRRIPARMHENRRARPTAAPLVEFSGEREEQRETADGEATGPGVLLPADSVLPQKDANGGRDREGEISNHAERRNAGNRTLFRRDFARIREFRGHVADEGDAADAEQDSAEDRPVCESEPEQRENAKARGGAEHRKTTDPIGQRADR